MKKFRQFSESDVFLVFLLGFGFNQSNFPNESYHLPN